MEGTKATPDRNEIIVPLQFVSRCFLNATFIYYITALFFLI